VRHTEANAQLLMACPDGKLAFMTEELELQKSPWPSPSVGRSRRVDLRGTDLWYSEPKPADPGGDISPDSKYVLFTTSSKDGGMVDAFMHVMRLRDAPAIAGKSPALRRLHPHTKDGPVLPLTLGWEPHWTYGHIEGLK